MFDVFPCGVGEGHLVGRGRVVGGKQADASRAGVLFTLHMQEEGFSVYSET